VGGGACEEVRKGARWKGGPRQIAFYFLYSPAVEIFVLIPAISTTAQRVVTGLPTALVADSNRGSICISFVHVWYSMSFSMSVNTGANGGEQKAVTRKSES